MDSLLGKEDLKIVLGEVRRFARGVIAANVERPEHALPRPALEMLVAEATDAGFIPEAGEEATGLWVNVDDPLGPTLSARTLETLASVNPGIAWTCHMRAMPVWLAQRLNAPEALEGQETVVTLQGYHGLGRAALPRYLAGSKLGHDDCAVLSDWLLPTQQNARRVVHAPAGFAAVLSPCFDGEAVRWMRQPIDALDPLPLGPTLGLDEVDAVALASSDAGTPLGPDDSEEARKIFAEALLIQSLALVAVGLGCLRHARDLAREHAKVRVQGGRSIEHHPAVQSLLGSADTAVVVADALLGRMAEGPLRGNRIGEVFAARAEAHRLLCRGATDALQVFGGSGYMQDVGMEKSLRDSQQLRLMGGTPGELERFVAEWERVQ
jgi:alkylation response protein AidB-like acyl-CoA dehydrogenase